MAFCKNCGTPLPPDGLFCPTCGVRNDQISAGAGTDHQYAAAAAHTLVISRASQFVCAAVSYEVYINGAVLGKVPVGQSISTRIFSNTVRVEIRCTTMLMKHIKLWMVLRPERNPRLEFSLQYGGAIKASVSGAEILEHGSN